MITPIATRKCGTAFVTTYWRNVWQLLLMCLSFCGCLCLDPLTRGRTAREVKCPPLNGEFSPLSSQPPPPSAFLLRVDPRLAAVWTGALYVSPGECVSGSVWSEARRLSLQARLGPRRVSQCQAGRPRQLVTEHSISHRNVQSVAPNIFHHSSFAPSARSGLCPRVKPVWICGSPRKKYNIIIII